MGLDATTRRIRTFAFISCRTPHAAQVSAPRTPHPAPRGSHVADHPQQIDRRPRRARPGDAARRPEPDHSDEGDRFETRQGVRHRGRGARLAQSRRREEDAGEDGDSDRRDSREGDGVHDRPVPVAGVAARVGRGEEGRPDRLRRVRARHAQRLYGRRAGLQGASASRSSSTTTASTSSSVRLSDDGTMAIFVRGSGQNRVGWVANPSHDPNGPRPVGLGREDGWHAVPGVSRRSRTRRSRPAVVAAVAADPRAVARRQVRRVRARRAALSRQDLARRSRRRWTRPACRSSRSGDARAIRCGRPTASKLAFVSTRENHAFIGVYDMKTRRVDFLVAERGHRRRARRGRRTASASRSSVVRALRSAQQVAAKAPNGQAATPAPGGGGGGRAVVAAAAVAARGAECAVRAVVRPAVAARADAAVRGWLQTAGAAQSPTRVASTVSVARRSPAATRSRSWSRTSRRARRRSSGTTSRTTGRSTASTRSRGPATTSCSRRSAPNDEWDRYFSVSIDSPQPEPVLLTTTDGLINDSVADRTFVTTAFSRDGKTFYYCTNAKDIEKRHIWAVPTSGGTPKQISTDDGVEVSPTPLASGKQIAVLYFNATQPASIGIVPTGRRRDEGRLSRRSTEGFPAGRARDAGDRASRTRPTASRFTTSSSCRRTSSRVRSVRRSCSCTAARRARCCRRTTTCSSTTGRTRTTSGSRRRATS